MKAVIEIQVLQYAATILAQKKGTQQTRKTPIITPTVTAALWSETWKEIAWNKLINSNMKNSQKSKNASLRTHFVNIVVTEFSFRCLGTLHKRMDSFFTTSHSSVFRKICTLCSDIIKSCSVIRKNDAEKTWMNEWINEKM